MKSKSTAVLLGTYNGEPYLREQLQSLADQSYQDYICYIHDDGSTDRTLDIAEAYARRYPDRFKVLSYKANHGAIGNFMSLARYVLKHSSESYFLFCDQDDYWDARKIEKQVSMVRQNEMIGKPYLLYCDCTVTDERLQTIAESGMLYTKCRAGVNDTYKKLVFRNTAAGCAMCMNRACLELAINYVNDEHIFMHDWWFMLIGRYFGKVGFLDEPLMKYRQHGSNALGVADPSLSGRIKTITKDLPGYIKAKRINTLKLKQQILDIGSIPADTPYRSELTALCKHLNSGWLSRSVYLLSEGYIRPSEFMTLFFL